MSLFDRSGAGEFKPTRAIIDIGSNTVRLVVYGGPPRAPTVLLNEKVTARLGRNIGSTGRLSAKAMDAALAALARYRTLLKLLGVDNVEVVATAAVRDAADGADFLARVQALGLSPRLLSGEEEAITSTFGVIGAFPGARGVVADLGGGSLELTDVDGETCSHGVSLPLGTLGLPSLRAGGHRAFARMVGKALAGADWSATPEPAMYLVGGSFRSFARHVMTRRHWLSDDPHGFRMTAQDALRIARPLSRKRADQLAPVPGISAARLAALPDAAALLEVLIKLLKPTELIFSSWGLREGLLIRALEPAMRRQDPLLAGASAFVERHGTSAAGAAMVVGWCAQARFADEAAYDERLRLATAMLALASSHIEPNRRPGLAVDWALRKRWIGASPEDRVLMAATLMANSGRADLPREWAAYASADGLRAARAWGLAVRLCRRFSGCSAQSLSNSALVVRDGALVLVVARPYAVLVSESVERDLKALAGQLGLKARWEVVESLDGLR